MNILKQMNENRENINVGAWADSIREDVVGFLTEKGYENTSVYTRKNR